MHFVRFPSVSHCLSVKSLCITPHPTLHTHADLFGPRFRVCTACFDRPRQADEVERLIARVCTEHPEWLAKPQKIQQEVIRQLPDRLKVWGGPNWPGKSAIQNRLKRIRPKFENRPPEVEQLDMPWSVGCLAKYDMPPDALPIVMRIYEERLREEEQRFTIREALWIARLHKTIDDPTALEPFASAYALREWLDWILDNPIYTRDLDIAVIRYMNKQLTRDEIIKHPWHIHPLPTWGREEEEELEKKLRKKGYTLGIELTEEGGTP